MQSNITVKEKITPKTHSFSSNILHLVSLQLIFLRQHAFWFCIKVILIATIYIFLNINIIVLTIILIKMSIDLIY